MRKFIGKIKTDKVGSACDFEFEVEDNATEEEIECDARNAAFEYVEWHFEEVK